ncbi:MAG: replication-relaxation family protein [Actinomycetota bacterium]|nr:replication-relaxation family protein [Actinomycetota bacterium]MDP9485208.1 replication-relaxation family protein [Actinomycetota bacterium]
MTLLTGKKGTIGERDEKLLYDLYFAERLTTANLTNMHFPRESKTKDRMGKLKKKGYVVADFCGKQALWKLTADGFAFVADSLGRPYGEHERYPDRRLSPKRDLHHVDTVDIFARLKTKDEKRRGVTEPSEPRNQNLDDLLGPYPNWEWRSERRARRALKDANDDTVYQPDAEVHFGGEVFVIERETERSRGTYDEMLRKLRHHKLYIEHVLRKPAETEILYACDEERDMTYAERAGKKLDLLIFAGSPYQVAEYLLDNARKFAAHRARQAS